MLHNLNRMWKKINVYVEKTNAIILFILLNPFKIKIDKQEETY